MTDKYAVIGNPVGHSLSPAIHANFARATGEDIVYGAILAPLDVFRAEVLKFRDAGGKGLNVTLPFKHDAWRLVDVHSGYATTAGAVNTIEFRPSKAVGHNSDGIGLVRDIRENLECEIRGKRVLLMGAGGASYGIMEPLLRERPDQLVVANRTFGKAADMIHHFENLRKFAARGIAACRYEELGQLRFDIVINATAAGLHDTMPPLPRGMFTPGALAYDMVYGRRTPFMKFADDQGAISADGLGMLVEQAAESFFIWRGVRPRTKPVIALLRETGERGEERGERRP